MYRLANILYMYMYMYMLCILEGGKNYLQRVLLICYRYYNSCVKIISFIYPTLYITAIEWEEVMNHNSLP